MTRLKLILVFLSLVLASCSSVKQSTSNVRASGEGVKDKVVANAIAFKGVRYKYGGTTKKGMDCSGLLYTAFKKENILLPRVSKEMAKKGVDVSLSRVQKGDFLFFRTNKNSKHINHVALVTSAYKGQIKFIHSTTSRGVIISSLSEKYWKNAFVKARKIL